MSGKLIHSPAHILARLLIGLGEGVAPPPSSSSQWPIYYVNEPDRPDNVITVQNTTGRMFGREQISGETYKYHGIQFRIRSSVDEDAYSKAADIEDAIKDVYKDTVTIGARTYCVQSISQTTDIIDAGHEPETERVIHTLNALAEITDITGQ